MRRILPALCVTTALTGMMVSAQDETRPQRPVFQASSDLVAIDVFVQSGSKPVTGLTTADFTITDNGTRQRIERLDAEAMPLDVTLVLDVSGITGGAWTTSVPPARVMAEAAAKVQDTAAVLRPDDRLRVIVSDTYNRRISSWKAAREATASTGDRDVVTFMSTAGGQGLSSVYDALAAALIESVPYGRRHAVVAWTKSRDTISTTDAAALRTIAYQSDAALHLVLRDSGTNKTPVPVPGAGANIPGGGAQAPPVPADAAGSPAADPDSPEPPDKLFNPANEEFSTQSFAHTWKPFDRNDPILLRDAATLTGGTFHDTGVLRDRDVVAEFRDVFETYRQGYVLRYAPRGVTREGWHDVVVRVPKIPNATIRARHGYAIETGPVAARPDATPARVSPLDDAVAAFNRRDDAGVQAGFRRTRDLRGFIRDYRAGANPWPSNARHEAIFVVQLGLVGLMSSDSDTRAEAAGLLGNYRELVRSPFALRQHDGLTAHSFECRWYGAAFAAFEGALIPSPVLRMIDAAIERCPGDGGLRLARAIATDQQSSTRTTPLPDAGTLPRPTADVVVARYAEAAAFPAVADEARIRAAWSAYRNQKLGQAQELLSAVSQAPSDPVVNYFGHVVRGQVLRKLGDTERAIAEYTAALAIVPGAQGPRVNLMTLLVQGGRRTEAERLAEAIETAPAASFDPWWVYWLGDYRSFTARIAELRTLVED